MASTNSQLIPGATVSSPGSVQEDIRSIKPPMEIPSSFLWLWWVLGLVAAAAILWLLWKKLRRRKATTSAALVVPPHRRAKEKLRSANELLSDPYAFCSLVSDVVRVYLEERFALHAPERTTEEFLAELRLSTALRFEHKELLEAFLSRCDLVKFARAEPTQAELEELLKAALRLIDETAPVTEPVSSTPSEKQAA